MSSDSPLHDELLAALKRRGAPAREINVFRRHLGSLEAGADLPCPFCFVNHRAGVLTATPAAGGSEFLCGTCGVRLPAR